MPGRNWFLLEWEMNESELRNRLESALLTDTEMAEGPLKWRHYPDPVEPWFD
ncbi:metal chaperone [Klebsiella pneumoniae]|uniref:Metal chaperone n=1 Tax=Klebsiella pneumoniae TaxID=573 RepID=A0A2X3BW92_KLEPN|nr:metal chaperone [Klebsiella pneumoniae]